MTSATSDREGDVTLALHAYVDGELDPVASLAMQRRIEREPTLAAEAARIRGLRALVRASAPLETASAALTAKLLSASRSALPARQGWRGSPHYCPAPSALRPPACAAPRFASASGRSRRDG